MVEQVVVIEPTPNGANFIDAQGVIHPHLGKRVMMEIAAILDMVSELGGELRLSYSIPAECLETKELLP